MAEEQAEYPEYGSVDEELQAGIRRGAEELDRQMRTPEFIAWQKRADEGWRKLLDEWQAEHGAFTEEELATAREHLGIGNGRKGVVRIIDIGPREAVSDDSK